MSNSKCLLDVLNRRCFGRHGFCSRPEGGRHQDCIGKTARRAAIYSDQMCETILAGARGQFKADRRVHNGEVGIHCAIYDGDDEVSKVMMVAGGARRGLVSSVLNVDNAPCRDNCCVKPDGRVITPTGGS